jgi:hypothetical protein
LHDGYRLTTSAARRVLSQLADPGESPSCYRLSTQGRPRIFEAVQERLLTPDDKTKELAISVMEFEDPLLTRLGISVDFLIVFLLDELVSAAV